MYLQLRITRVHSKIPQTSNDSSFVSSNYANKRAICNYIEEVAVLQEEGGGIVTCTLPGGISAGLTADFLIKLEESNQVQQLC